MRIHKYLEILHVSLELSTVNEVLEAIRTISIFEKLNNSQKSSLLAIHDSGPLEDGDIPSKVDRDFLLSESLITKIIVKGVEGYNACGYRGYSVVNLIKFERNTFNEKILKQITEVAVSGKSEPLTTADKAKILAAASMSNDEGTLKLAIKLTNSEPCLGCGYIKEHCKCPPITFFDVIRDEM